MINNKISKYGLLQLIIQGMLRKDKTPKGVPTFRVCPSPCSVWQLRRAKRRNDCKPPIGNGT